MIHFSIATRLKATLGLLALMLVAIAATAIWQMGQMRTSTQEIVSNWLPSIELVSKMEAGLLELRVAQFEHVLNDDDQAMVTLEKRITEVLTGFDQHQKAFAALLSSDDEVRLNDAFLAEWKQYQQLNQRALDLSRSNANEEATALLEGEAKAVFDRAKARLTTLVEYNGVGAASAAKASESAYAFARGTMMVAALLGVALSIAAALWLAQSISRPLQQALAAADRVAAGDLTSEGGLRSNDEAGQVLQALDRMRESLSRVVAHVRSNSESVATASAQIAQGNQDLSSRTERQASALQQTAATMDELGVTVRNNADSADQANRLARRASEVATQGGEVVSQVVSTMQGIHDSSRRIADIIGVIDGIAFQTNILALNAAVEAARAGEQGRGFAVVATEVRGLASRSAAAAKEIKALIDRSVEQVGQGTSLVDDAGKTMSEIVVSIQRVSDIVGEIASASVEQSRGVQQVGTAVTQMDQATQQNAALVEESAAAAESLKDQAHQLVEAVAVFRLAERSARGA